MRTTGRHGRVLYSELIDASAQLVLSVHKAVFPDGNSTDPTTTEGTRIPHSSYSLNIIPHLNVPHSSRNGKDFEPFKLNLWIWKS
ncbi:unnamed protein product [Gongylonema pulchrum]|uniref:Uncharacterized protein n=1 Tax=Gongylonema pulchrum TaxID=637853 RepID=A0A183DSB7_9BILA|nr:unnamed protein product [Gongylonema pulchrum]